MKCAATDRKILTTEGAAALVPNTTPNAIRIKAYRKQIPHIKSGNRLLFYEDEILAWLEGQRRVTTEEAIEAVTR